MVFDILILASWILIFFFHISIPNFTHLQRDGFYKGVVMSRIQRAESSVMKRRDAHRFALRFAAHDHHLSLRGQPHNNNAGMYHVNNLSNSIKGQFCDDYAGLFSCYVVKD